MNSFKINPEIKDKYNIECDYLGSGAKSGALKYLSM